MGKEKYKTTKLVIRLEIFEATSGELGEVIPTGPRYNAEHHISTSISPPACLNEDELIGLEVVKHIYRIQKERRMVAEHVKKEKEARNENKATKP